ncbi:GATOR complex protein WDR24 isoform X2 [Cimex lectularius]|uniref:GATOR2 complex protein WDR24 n=1 Tax=Cimex lectularius TaxID=79782 RepID=A0A8I6TJA5_CIMLE|nr:GATOR complex protein WDR24 isoform X2 [Cimex lectularius]
MSKTIYVVQEGPANALALKKDNSQVVIAGRNVFKIFSIEEDEFVERSNLRVGKNLNLNFSCNDVAWNSIDDHILATAATNGAVVVWNLNRPSRSKQEHVFADHKRTVNKVSFNPAEPSWLISGSQDGTIRTFDLRTKSSTNIFFSNTESVRDVQFCPNSHMSFACVSENGNVQTWDMRKPDKCVLQFTAHSGPIFACDWHPDCPWLATASRDKTIKVWDMSCKPILEYTINTIASVGRVKWRPQHKYHIASVALVVDCSVNVWDVRRPYIPYAAFTKHKDVATGISWRGDPNICLTTSRDSTLYQHVFNDASYPAMHANPQALDISPMGHVAFACRLNVVPKQSKIQGILRRSNNSSEEFWQATSILNIFSRDINKETDWLHTCAKEYILTGKPLGELCDHNSNVTRRMGRLAVSLLWTMVKTLYTNKNVEVGFQTPSREETIENDDKREKMKENNAVGDSGVSDEMSGTLGDSVGDFFFGDSEMDPLSMDFEINGLDGLISQDWTLPTEAFPLRHEIQDRSPPPEQFPNHDSPDQNDDGFSENPINSTDNWNLLGQVAPIKLNSWDHCQILAEALKAHAEMGDVQTPVCILTALGEKRSSLLAHIELHSQEIWVLSYVELLSQQRLWTQSNEIIKLSWLPCVSQMNQKSTTVYTGCNQCDKPFVQGGWRCPKCDTAIVCSVCHQVVHGLYVWCQGCMHGGHLAHMKEWLKDNNLCPTGCGHACEFI